MPIRHLNRSDKEKVLALDGFIFKTLDPYGGWRDNDFNQFFNQESCYIYFDEKQPDAVIGYIFATQEDNHLYISNLGSDPRTGKRGIGTALIARVMLQELENSQKKSRPFLVKLHVDAHNIHAIEFYKRLGFKEVGRDYHGIQMTATELPEKFKKMEASTPAPKPRSALIIRNVEGIQFDDLKVVLEGLEPDVNAPLEFNQLIRMMRGTLSEREMHEALALFKKESVRNYLYELVKEKTGSHIIYHMNGLEDSGRINASEVSYITKKLQALPANTDFDMMYLGGGHGSPYAGSSNLSREQLEEITKTIHRNNIKCSALILGSCFSSAYLGLYQPLLKTHGVTLSNSLECGGYNGFKQAIRWIRGQQKEFYSNEDIRGSIIISPEERDNFKRVIEEGLGEPGHRLLHTYTAVISHVIGTLPEAETQGLAEEFLHNNLIEFITDMHVLGTSLTKEKIQESLAHYPHLFDYIKAIERKKGDDSIFDALIHCIKPIPTSLALGTSTTLTLFKFSEAGTIPSSSADDYKRNYRAVLHEVELSGGFSEIREVLSGFDQVSAKRQFNELFAQATGQLADTRKEEQRQDQLRQDQLRQDQLRQDQLRQDQLRQDQLRQDQLRQDQLRQDQLRQDQLRQDQLRQDQLRQEQSRQEQLRQEQLRQEQLRQEQSRQEQLRQKQQERHKIFKKALNKMRDKAEELNRRREPEAYSVALKLYNKLDKAGNIYFQHEASAERFEQFKNKCEKHIKRSRKELNKHRGWSEFLFNLFLAIGTLGIGLVVKGAINLANNRSFFFVHQTDTSKKLDEIEDVIPKAYEPNL